MTKDEALRLALEALEEIGLKWPNVLKTIDAVKEGLETKDDPVAWGMQKDGVILDVISPDEHEREEGGYTVPLYTKSQLETKDEPVAWRYDQAKYRTNDLRGRQWAFNVFSQTKPYIDEMVQNVTPLYTTPQPKLETKDEPVAWMSTNDVGFKKSEFGSTPTVPLYTTPPQRTWVGLTDEEIHNIAWPHGGETMQAIIKHTVLQAEQLLKEKNT